MPNPKNRKTASSAKMGTDELKELIKSAVKEAMSGTKDDGATDAPLDGISTNDVLGVIEQAIEAVSEKHKADVEAGGEDNGVTTEEIVQEAAALLAELAPDETQACRALIEKNYGRRLREGGRDKVIAALARRGFSYGAIRAALEQCGETADEDGSWE